MAATGAAQLRPKPGLFLWGHFDDNLGGHGRFSSAVRLMGVVPVSLNETAAALNPLLLCPISLWPDLELTRSWRISWRTASWKALLCRGGNRGEAGQAALDDADGMDKREPVRIFTGLQRRFVHQATNGKMSHQQSVKLLLD